MRKRIISQTPQNVSLIEPSWLDLQRLAHVELTSEDAATRSRQRCYPTPERVGGRHTPGSKRSVYCSTSCRMSGVFNYCFRKSIRRAHKSSFCGGRPTPVNLTGRLCVSNITLVRRT